MNKSRHFLAKLRSISESSDSVDVVSIDVPLLTRLLEYAHEDVKDDAELHVVLTKVIELSKENTTLTMDNYNDIVGMTQANESKIKIDVSSDRLLSDIKDELISITKKNYPNVNSEFTVKIDDNTMYTVVRGEDRVYSVLDLDTGEVDILGD